MYTFLVLACLLTYVACATVKPARLNGCGGQKLKDVVQCMISSEFNQRKDYEGCMCDCYSNNKCVMNFGYDNSGNGCNNCSQGGSGGQGGSGDHHDDDNHGNQFDDPLCYNLTNPFEKYNDDERMESCFESFKENTTNFVLSFVKKAIKNFEIPNLNDTFNNATMEAAMTEMQNKMMKMMNDSRRFNSTTCNQTALNQCLKKCVAPQDRCIAETTCAQKQTTCDFELTKKLYMQNGKYVIKNMFPRLKKGFYGCLGVKESDYPVTPRHIQCFKHQLMQEYNDTCSAQTAGVTGMPPKPLMPINGMPPMPASGVPLVRVTLNPTMIINAMASAGYTMPPKNLGMLSNVTTPKPTTKRV